MTTKHLLLFAISVGLAFGQDHTFHKAAADLQNLDARANVNVIVQFNQVPTEAHHRRVLSRGGQHNGTFTSVSGASYTIPAAALADLENDESVVHVSLDHPVQSKLDLATSAVNMQAVWAKYPALTGAGVGVALIDSGVGYSSDLEKRFSGRVLHSQNFVKGAFDSRDHYGHGEHIAGIIASSGNACATCTRVFKGVAPGVNLINFRVLDQNGEGTDSAVINALETAVLFKDVFNIRVINLSLGRPVYESYKLDPLCQAVEAAWKAGIVVVVAAGNDGRENTQGNQGYGTINSPGNDPYVITVGAMKTNGTSSREDDTIASYSSKGPSLIDGIVKPDIVAPGNKIVSLLPQTSATLPKKYPENAVLENYYDSAARAVVSTQYFMLSGTSMAAGVVSGAAALLVENNPTLTPDQVKITLMRNAYKKFPSQSTAVDTVTGQTFLSYYDAFTVGAGYLDVAAALADTNSYTGSSLSPVASFNTSTRKVAVAYAANSVWGSSMAWGGLSASTVAWGGLIGSDKTLAGAQSAAWGTSSAWGASGLFSTSTNAAQNALWIESMAWGGLEASAAAWGASSDHSDKTPLQIAGEQ